LITLSQTVPDMGGVKFHRRIIIQRLNLNFISRRNTTIIGKNHKTCRIIVPLDMGILATDIFIAFIAAIAGECNCVSSKKTIVSLRTFVSATSNFSIGRIYFITLLFGLAA